MQSQLRPEAPPFVPRAFQDNDGQQASQPKMERQDLDFSHKKNKYIYCTYCHKKFPLSLLPVLGICRHIPRPRAILGKRCIHIEGTDILDGLARSRVPNPAIPCYIVISDYEN